MTSYQGNIIIKNPATPTGPFENGTAPGIWKLNEALAFKRQGIWPTQGVQSPDAYFEYVSLLLSTTSLSNANNNLFVDSSGAFNPISRNGNPTQGSAMPYGSNWSAYLDNSGDYLTTGGGSSEFAFGTGNFTIEAWFFANGAVSNWKPMLSVGAAAQGQLIRINQGLQFTGNWGMLYPNDAGNSDVYFDTGSPFPLNQWVHVALVRNGTTLTLYQNGVNVLQKTVGFNFTNTTGVAIGYGQYAGDGVFGGYISNVRIVKGTAVYTSNFTPSTTPLTAISGTSLLACQSNRFRDASANNFTVTPVGDTRVTDFSPFNPTYPGITYNQSDITNWSGYFDGSGDYLTVPSSTALTFGTGDFTEEAWIYMTTSSNDEITLFGIDTTTAPLFGVYQQKLYLGARGTAYDVTASVNIPLFQWVHVAVTRQSGTVTLWQNGVAVGSGTVTRNYPSGTAFVGTYTSSGAPFYQGYISNLRVVKGTAVYTSAFTPPTSPLTAISGTSLLTLQNAAFTDNSINSFPITITGNTTVTGNSPFNTVGYWSNYFDGSGDYLTASSANFAFGTGAWTVEFWIYPLAYGGSVAGAQLFGTVNGATSGYSIQLGQDVNSFRITSNATGSWADNLSVGTGNGPPLNAWTHMAVVRSGANLSIYKNGTRVATTASATSWNFSGTTGVIGRFNDGTWTRDLNGYLSNLRVANTAIYDPTQSTITVPTTPPTAVSGTQLLTCQNGRFIDNSANALSVTVNGNPSVQSFDPFYTATTTSSGGSMYFDGSDYINAPTSPFFGLGTSNYTIEMWVFPTANPGNGPGTIFDLRTGPTATATVARINSSLQLLVYNGPANVEFVAGTVPLNAWTHIALVRSSGSLVTYINGAVSNTTTLSSDLGSSQPCFIGVNQTAGYNFNGYISDFRITKGTAVYTSAFTPPAAPLTPSAATTLLVNGMNAGIYDAAAVNNIETVGNSQVSTVQSKFGGSSVYFDGSSRLTMPPTADMDLSSGDFTVEAWVYSTTLSGTGSAATRAAAGNITSATELQWGIYRSGSSMIVRPYQSSTDFSINVGTIAANTWYHVAMTRSGNTIRGFLNGVLAGTTQTISGALNNNAAWFGVLIGGITVSGGSEYWNGYIDDLRITKGYARYTSTFTPPTQAFPPY